MIKKQIVKQKKIDDNKKNIVLTFDYELSLGIDSGTAAKCIIEPTNILLNLLENFNAKGIFFIDAAYLLILKKSKHSDLKLISKQLCDIVKSGHDIGLHLHPHWLDAEMLNDKRWTFKSFSKYRLHDLTENEIFYLVKNGIKILKECIRKNIQIKAFRAGGYSLQPFNILKKHFLNNKIYFDFNANPGIFSKPDSYSYYDYRACPEDLAFWKFSDDPCIKNNNGSFVEIPITTVKVLKFDLWCNYYFYRKKEIEFGDGKSIGTKKTNSNFIKKIFNGFSVFKKMYTSVSVDGLSHKYFLKFFERMNKDLDFYTFICHPKKLTNSGIENLKFLLEKHRTLGIKELEKKIKMEND